MLHVESGRDGVAKRGTWIQVHILQFGLAAVFVRRKGVVVASRSCESQIGELHHCFKVLGRATAGYGFGLVADTIIYGSLFAGQNFFQFNSAEIAKTA